MNTRVAHLILMMVATAAWAVAATAFAEGRSAAVPPDDRLLAAVEVLAQPSSEDGAPPHDAPNSAGPADAGKAAEASTGSPIPEKRVISVPDQMDRIMTLHEKASRMKGDQTFEGWANEITKRSNETATKLGSLIPARKPPDKLPKVAAQPSAPPAVAPVVATGASAPLDARTEKSPASNGDAGQRTEPAADYGVPSPEKTPEMPNAVTAPSGEAESAASTDARVDAPASSPVPHINSDWMRTVVRGPIPPLLVPAAAPAATPSVTIEAQQRTRESILWEIERLVREQLRLLERAHEQPAD